MKPDGFGWRPGTIVPGLCLLVVVLAPLSLPSSSAAQPALATKQRFVTGLIEFLEAATGFYGDEGSRLLTSIDGMDAGLRRWDVAVDAYQRAMTPQLASATPSVAAALRVSLAAVYLERGRVTDALAEFDAASRLAPERPDIHLYRALAFDSLHRADAQAEAVRRAWMLDPQDPVKAYLYLRLAENGSEGTATARQALADAVESAAASGRAGPISPFVRLTLLEEPATRDTVFAPVRYAHAFAALESGDYEAAIGRFREAAARDPLLIDPGGRLDSIRRGRTALREGKIEAAIDSLLEGSRDAPQSSEAHRTLAIAYWLDDQQEKAIDRLQEAIRLSPDDERSRTMLADVLSDAKQLARAEQALLDAVKVMPASGQLHWRLGRLYQVLQREVDARVEFERSLQLNPVAGRSLIQAAIARWYLRETNLPAAIDAARRYVELDLNDAAAHKELGGALRAAGRDEEALGELLAAAWLNPADADLLRDVGQIYLTGGQYEPAWRVLQRAVESRPSSAESRYALAMAFARAGKETEGAEQMEIARRLQAEALAESRRGYETGLLKIEAALKSRQGDHAASARLWQQIVEREPKAASNQVSLGEALALAGRHEEAVAAFNVALKASDVPMLHRSLAAEYDALGRREEAAQERLTYRKIKEERLQRLGTDR